MRAWRRPKRPRWWVIHEESLREMMEEAKAGGNIDAIIARELISTRREQVDPE